MYTHRPHVRLSSVARRFRLPGLAAALVVAASASIGALQPTAAQIIRGQVLDSLTRSPIPGSTVHLIDTLGMEIGRTKTDPEGLFLLRSSAPGWFRLRVEQEGYRSSEFPAFELGPDDVRGFGLLVAAVDRTGEEPAVPSPASDSTLTSFLNQVCGEGGIEAGRVVLLGQVRDAETGAPVPEANVALTWSTVPQALERHLGSQFATSTAVTGSTGYYAVCGPPTGTTIGIHAEFEGHMSEFSTLRFVDGGVDVLDTHIQMDGPIWRQDLELLPANRRTASIRGAIRDTAGALVASARVTVLGARVLSTRANFLGGFELTGLPPGALRLTAEQVGYRTTDTLVTLGEGETLELPVSALVLTQEPLALAPIEVEAEPATSRRNLDEFERRRRTTSGEFITREEWERFGTPDETVDILRRLHGLRIRVGTFEQPWIITATRTAGRTGLDGGQCFPLIFVDRLFIGSTGNVELDRALPINDLEAVEFYSGTSLPPEFNRTGSACGVLVFWTR